MSDSMPNRYKVAQHLLDIIFDDDELAVEDVLPSFEPFRSDDKGTALLTMTVRRGKRPDFSQWEEIGQFDCGGANHGVYRTADMCYAFEISLPDFQGGDLSCCMISNPDFTQCEAILTGAANYTYQFGLNNAMMMAYAFATAPYDTLLIHASVIRNAGYGYLFTAPSGTGKSTHTHLWYKNIPDCDLMNDDNPVVRIVDGETLIFGSPWSGKTPCYRNIWAPVGAITRIEQKPENSIRRMGPIEAFATLLPAVSSMKWDKRVYMSICGTIGNVLKTTPVFWLGCLPNADAAHVCYEAIRRA